MLSMLVKIPITFTMKGLDPCMDHVTFVASPAGASVNSAMLRASKGFRKCRGMSIFSTTVMLP